MICTHCRSLLLNRSIDPVTSTVEISCGICGRPQNLPTPETLSPDRAQYMETRLLMPNTLRGTK